MEDAAQFRLRLAEVLFVDAQVCLKNERYRSAISRAYYTCYHSARACLEKIGIAITSRSEHDACVRLFGKHLVLTGIFPRWMGELINDLKDERENADYKWDFAKQQEIAKDLVPRSQDFIREVQAKWDELE